MRLLLLVLVLCLVLPVLVTAQSSESIASPSISTDSPTVGNTADIASTSLSQSSSISLSPSSSQTFNSTQPLIPTFSAIPQPTSVPPLSKCCSAYLNFVGLCLQAVPSMLTSNATLSMAVGPMYACTCAQDLFVDAFVFCYMCLAGSDSGLTTAAVQNACNAIENGQVTQGYGLALGGEQVASLTSALPALSSPTGSLSVLSWPGYSAAKKSDKVRWENVVVAMAVGLVGVYTDGWY